MKILTWNINGIRASKVLLKDLFNSLDADIICLQETKVTRDQLDGSVAAVDGYNSYFSFSRKRSGYSGVATFCKESVTPWKAEEGLSGHAVSPNKDGGLGSYGNLSHFTDDELDSLDAEGRSVITQHKIRGPDGKEKELAIINVYCPRADAEREDRKLYKLRFYALLQTRAEALLQSGSHVIVLGDINSCHKQIDRCDPEEDTERVRPGRLWMNQLVWESGRDPSLTANDDEQLCLPGTTPSTKGGQFIDTFRHFHPHQKDAFTCWCTLTGARQTNYGRRLDYVFADVNLTDEFITDTVIMPEVEGSDHCPVRCDLCCEVVPCDKCPALCTKYMPEFSGKQQKLSDLFLKASAKSLVKKNSNPNDHHLDQNASQKCASPISGGDFSGKQKTPSQKRPFTKENSLSGTNKRQKTQKSQQSNLMNFFGKPKTSVVETKVIHKPASSQVNHGCSDIKGKLSSAVESFGNPEILPEVNLDTDVFGSNNQSKSVSKSGSADSDTDSGVTSSQEAVCNSHSSGDSGTVQITSQSTSEKTKSSAALAWKTLLSGPGKAPLCKGHKEPCVLRTVKKDGPNRGKQFYVCARGEGHSSNPEARCDFFKWVERKKPS